MAIKKTEEEQNFPEGITQEMIDAAKKKHLKVAIATLRDSEQTVIANILVGTPSPWAIGEWEKFLDKDGMKAREVLINSCVCDPEQKKMVKGFAKNSEEYAAAYDAAAKMIPVGKSTLKNV